MEDKVSTPQPFPVFLKSVTDSLAYAAASSRPLTTLRLPTALAAMNPHTWIFAPPCLGVGILQSGWYSSPTLFLMSPSLESVQKLTRQKTTFPPTVRMFNLSSPDTTPVSSVCGPVAQKLP